MDFKKLRFKILEIAVTDFDNFKQVSICDNKLQILRKQLNNSINMNSFTLFRISFYLSKKDF